ncbi:hypothetical protein LZG04_15255 [Saccharothrix sp. S26]|uniref:hypothetical protein n=1 Tax=Saccharothrix sp. S26 TaxID=2907215 RepID=UPI001F324CF3|nr:hypothetical protein [Saccharothrix sp. S26]MCE6996150.1 hypothetical protein [Saccharothrix sp. S26]
MQFLAPAFVLCDNGVRRGDPRAVTFAYDHANWYVDKALERATKCAEAAAGITVLRTARTQYDAVPRPGRPCPPSTGCPLW